MPVAEVTWLGSNTSEFKPSAIVCKACGLIHPNSKGRFLPPAAGCSFVNCNQPMGNLPKAEKNGRKEGKGEGEKGRKGKGKKGGRERMKEGRGERKE